MLAWPMTESSERMCRSFSTNTMHRKKVQRGVRLNKRRQKKEIPIGACVCVCVCVCVCICREDK